MKIVAEYTQYAMKAMSLADLFGMVFGKDRITGAVSYRVEMSAPDGPSTAGGKQALQHLKLVPEGGGATIVFGTAQRAENRGELRTFGQLASLHAARYRGAEIPLNRVQYEELFNRIQKFLSDQSLRVEVLRGEDAVAPPAAAIAAAAANNSEPSRALAIAFGVLLMLAVGGGLFFFLSSR